MQRRIKVPREREAALLPQIQGVKSELIDPYTLAFGPSPESPGLNLKIDESVTYRHPETSERGCGTPSLMSAMMMLRLVERGRDPGLIVRTRGIEQPKIHPGFPHVLEYVVFMNCINYRFKVVAASLSAKWE